MKKGNQKDIKGLSVSDVEYSQNRRGLAFAGNLLLDGEKVGEIEHKGDGGLATLYVSKEDDREEVNNRMDAYFEEEGLNPVERGPQMVEDLMDVYEVGKVLTEQEKEDLLNN